MSGELLLAVAAIALGRSRSGSNTPALPEDGGAGAPSGKSSGGDLLNEGANLLGSALTSLSPYGKTTAMKVAVGVATTAAATVIGIMLAASVSAGPFAIITVAVLMVVVLVFAVVHLVLTHQDVAAQTQLDAYAQQALAGTRTWLSVYELLHHRVTVDQRVYIGVRSYDEVHQVRRLTPADLTFDGPMTYGSPWAPSVLPLLGPHENASAWRDLGNGWSLYVSGGQTFGKARGFVVRGVGPLYESASVGVRWQPRWDTRGDTRTLWSWLSRTLPVSARINGATIEEDWPLERIFDAAWKVSRYDFDDIVLGVCRLHPHVLCLDDADGKPTVAFVARCHQMLEAHSTEGSKWKARLAGLELPPEVVPAEPPASEGMGGTGAVLSPLFGGSSGPIARMR